MLTWKIAVPMPVASEFQLGGVKPGGEKGGIRQGQVFEQDE
jgi:hypothetical protein